MGFLMGGLLAIFALSMLCEWLLFRHIVDDPVTGKLLSVLAAWLIAGTVGGFGFADGGPFDWKAYFIYLIPTMVAVVWAIYRGKQARERIAEEGDPDDAALADTFK